MACNPHMTPATLPQLLAVYMRHSKPRASIVP
jgi:hypothetical protein